MWRFLKRGSGEVKDRHGRGSWWSLAGLGLFCLSLPTKAQAHTPIPGMGEVGSGLLHPLLTPSHLLVLLALGFLLGQQRPLRLGLPMAVFAVAAAVGLLVTATGLITGVLTPPLMLIALPAGGLVALALPLPFMVRLSICGVAALVLGLDSGVDAGLTRFAAGKTLTANWVSLCLCVVNIAFYISLLPPLQWVQTGVRIVGSWLVAIALLMLAFALKRG